MKKLKKISLSELSKAQLDEHKIGRILGGAPGDACQCGCKYENSGGSSTSANSSANLSGGLNSGSCPTPPPPSQTYCPAAQYIECVSKPPAQISICQNQPSCWA